MYSCSIRLSTLQTTYCLAFIPIEIKAWFGTLAGGADMVTLLGS